MWCFVSQPNSVILEVQVDQKAIGQFCLEKVCEQLGIGHEVDYFGLKHANPHHKNGSQYNTELWLNLRNPIARQTVAVTPRRFSLRVKFWVPPHLLLQDPTRHQFYLCARHDLFESLLRPTTWAQAARLCALIVQSEAGDYDSMRPAQALYTQCCTSVVAEEANESQNKPSDYLQRIVNEHKNIKGMKPSTAEYWLLKEIAVIETFGEEMFTGKSNGPIRLGVGPHGISVYKNNEKQSIPYTAIVSALSQKKMFRLNYLSVDAEEENLSIKLDSSHAASSLYRAITEKHAFYSCETVRSAVTTQFTRDLKGTIISIFNEDSPLGKKYVFDIRRTCREVYDNARRAIYQEGAGAFNEMPPEDERMFIERLDREEGEVLKDSRESQVSVKDALMCRICMDEDIDTAFLPCAHALACNACSQRCDRCPLCRAPVSQLQRIYLPVDKHLTIVQPSQS